MRPRAEAVKRVLALGERLLDAVAEIADCVPEPLGGTAGKHLAGGTLAHVVDVFERSLDVLERTRLGLLRGRWDLPASVVAVAAESLSRLVVVRVARAGGSARRRPRV
jgi:hypothetical protein